MSTPDGPLLPDIWGSVFISRCPTCRSTGPRRVVVDAERGQFTCDDAWHNPAQFVLSEARAEGDERDLTADVLATHDTALLLAELARLRAGLQHVAARARIEGETAPGPMVAVYVRAEVAHVLAGHPTDVLGVNCTPCLASLQPTTGARP